MRIDRFHPLNIVVQETRRPVNEDTVVRLMDSIKSIGLKTLPTVRWPDNDEGDGPVLVTGRHRLEAVKRLGHETIDVFMFEGSADEARMWEISENLHRAELTAVERADHIEEWRRLAEEKVRRVAAPSPASQGKNQGKREAARQLGVSEREVRRAAKIANLPDVIKDQGRAENWSARRLLNAAQTDEQKEKKKVKKAADQQVAETEVEYFAEWLHRRVDPGELPALISWLEGCPPKAVIKALRRLAS